MSNAQVNLLWTVISVSIMWVPACNTETPGVQEIELRVIDIVTREPVSNAVITIAPQTGQSQWINCQQLNLSAEQCLDEYAEQRASPNPPDFHGTYLATTDEQGDAILVIDLPTPCIASETSDPCIPRNPEDLVTGVELYVRIESGTASEILSISLIQSNRRAGEFFEVAVVSIGEPIEAPVSEFRQSV